MSCNVLTIPEILALPIGSVVWCEGRWTDEEDGTARMSLGPMMRSSCCGVPVICDGESQSEIESLQADETTDGYRERYWSARPTEARMAATPWTNGGGTQ